MPRQTCAGGGPTASVDRRTGRETALTLAAATSRATSIVDIAGKRALAVDSAPGYDVIWLDVRVVVQRPKVSVCVDGQPTPSLIVDEPGDRTGGSVGVWIGEGSPGHFANLRVTRTP